MGWLRKIMYYLRTEKEFRLDVQKDMTNVEARLQNLEKHRDASMNLLNNQKDLIQSLYLAAHRHEEKNEDTVEEVKGNEVEGSQHQ